ncbi:glycoside hydrolase family 97 catalytic domain-containing protein [Herbiconiux sp. P16]|uniref:glycoside hydrolase family 97 catalytic domain-containing protein n=1 Tax=Herbiconiux wuyangfengii TaxID=3342794 RepID=UPI0035B9635F
MRTHEERRRSRPLALAAVTALALSLPLLTASPAQALTTHTITSPDGSINLTVTDQPGGALTYAVTAGTTSIFGDSPLGIATSTIDFSTGLSYSGETRSVISETYSLPAGTKPSYLNDGREMTLSYTKSGVTMQLIARAYNDGVAFRYRLPGSGAVSITNETTGFRLPTTSGGWAAPWNSNYEQDYIYRTATQLNSGTDLTMPALVSVNNNAYYTLISEANVYNANASYAPSMLEGDGAGTGLLKVSRTPDQAFPLSATYPFQTPWRMAIIASNLDTLYNSDLVQNLNPPAASTPSWVKPGRAAWSWYSDEDSASDLDKQKQMVDFAASMGFEYVTVDCCYTPSVDLPAISAYAAQRGVKIFAWVTADAAQTPAQANQLVVDHKAYGVAGLKVDFFLSDAQSKQQWYQSIGDAAGANQMMLDLHGSTKPGGENRTWPWVLTSEAVAGTEHYKYPPPTTAAADVTYPFTRGPLGPMDYTPAMISQNASVLTQGHTLAQAIVYNTGMINYADSAAAYEQWPGRHLMRVIPTTWDETKVVEGFPGDHITLARRSGSDWFIGAMTSPARTATVPLSFLGSGSYTATIFSDTAAGQVQVSTQTVTSATTLSLPMIATGGTSVQISHTPLAQIGSGDARYEAESAANTRGGSAAVAACKGCSTGSKVGNIGSGGSVQFNNVTAATAGTHRMTFSYTSADPRSVRITVNGTVLSTQNLPDSGGWEFVNKWSVDVPLVAGSNTIAFDNPSAFAPDIDALTIERRTEAEATGNTLSGGAATASCAGCSGGSLVKSLTGSAALDVNGVTVAAAGNHTVRLDYASATAQTVQVRVNGGTAITVALPATGSATAVSTKTLGLTLGAGTNVIRVTGASSAAVGVDRVSVVR